MDLASLLGSFTECRQQLLPNRLDLFLRVHSAMERAVRPVACAGFALSVLARPSLLGRAGTESPSTDSPDALCILISPHALRTSDGLRAADLRLGCPVRGRLRLPVRHSPRAISAAFVRDTRAFSEPGLTGYWSGVCRGAALAGRRRRATCSRRPIVDGPVVCQLTDVPAIGSSCSLSWLPPVLLTGGFCELLARCSA